MDMPDTCQIEQLTIYPVKSLRGINVDHWPVTSEGLRHDRQWMLVTTQGRFVTQRQLPAMALIDTNIDNGRLHLSAANKGSVSLPLSSITAGSAFVATVWSDECEVTEASAEASAWLTRILSPGQPLKLVTMSENRRRDQSQPERFGADNRTLFADAAPFLIANQASLGSLNQTLMTSNLAAVDMRRFRPNIVISGPEAFSEHQIKSLQRRGDSLRLILCDHCQRCVITTIDPDSGQKSSDLEPFKTLTKLNPMPDNHRAPAFGVNATLADHGSEEQSNTLVVGDKFTTLAE